MVPAERLPTAQVGRNDWSSPVSSHYLDTQANNSCPGHIPSVLCNKDETNLEFHSNRISSKFRIRIKSNMNIQWLQIRLPEHGVIPWPWARVRPGITSIVAIHISLYLFSDLTMKTTSYSCQTYHRISYVHIHTLGYKNKIIYIP